MKIKDKPNMLIKIIQKIKLPIFCIILVVNASNAYATDSSETLVKSQANPQLISKELKLANNEYSQEEVKETINNASIEAKKNQEDARKSLLEANKIVQKSNSSELIKIAKNRANIEQSRKYVAKLQLLLANNLQKTNEDLNKISLSLKRIESEYLKEELTASSLKSLYKETITNWRVLVDNSLMVFSKKDLDFEIKISNPSDLLYKFPDDLEDQSLITKYQDSYNLLQTEYTKILQLKTDLNSANKNYQSNLLLKAGKLRASILQRILALDEDFIDYDNEYVDDLIREIKLIPYRPIAVFYSKILKYKQTTQSGFVGFIYILKQLGLLGILVLILFISKGTLSKLTNLLGSLSQFCVKQSASNKSYSRIAIFLSKITPYFKWLILFFIFFLANIILENTLFSELGALIPYFQYYFLYKIFRLFAHYNLTNIAYKSTDNSSRRGELSRKIRKTTKSIGVYLLSSVYLLHLTQTVVRKAYFYNLTINLFLLGLLIISALISLDWKDEIKIVAKNKLSERFYKIISKLLSNRRSSFLFSLIILCFLFIRELVYKTIYLLKNYDFFKNLLSQIYRRKLESAAKKIDSDSESSVSNSYLREFCEIDDSETFVFIKDHPYEEIKSIIDSWQLNKSEENSISIHGEKGIGKSKFLQKIMLDNSNCEIIKTKFDKKVVSKEDLVKIVSGLFGQELGEKDLFKFLTNYDKKTIIILDDCHNLFLAKEGGFEALKIFFNFLVKIDNPNLLWISTFNSFSWYYLQNALKINNYFRHILRLSRWSDENIRELIIGKHNKTGFKLTYDPLIFAINTNKSEKEFEDLQLKFFQIIWSQSRGNPAIAISLWLSSLNQGYSKNIKISLPKTTKSSHLNNLSDEHLFVYGAIIKHQNLLISEISNILSITKEEVLNIVRIGLEKGYLTESAISNKRFTTSPEWQIAINQLLINRNFIYAE